MCGAARYGATYGRASPPRKQAERSNQRASDAGSVARTPRLSPALPSQWPAKTAAKRVLAQNARFEQYSGRPASQSRLPLRMPGGRAKRAVAGHSRGPVSVSIHGMRAPNGELGSCLPGLFSTHGFCTCRETRGSVCTNGLCRDRECNRSGVGSSCDRKTETAAGWMTGRGLQLYRLSVANERSALVLRVTRCGRCARGHHALRTGW
jgi:hypothetical protein